MRLLRQGVIIAVLVGLGLAALGSALAFDWVPSDEEIMKYRRSWNPFSHGPILNTGVDIQPKGQFLVQPFVFGQGCGLKPTRQRHPDSEPSTQTRGQAIQPSI